MKHRHKSTSSFGQLMHTRDGHHAWNGLNVYAVGASGHVYANAGGELSHNPASLNKLMVFALAMQDVKAGLLGLKDEKITISRNAANAQYSKLHVGHRLTVDKLVDAMMTGSDNGATTAIAERLAQIHGWNTVTAMNSMANRLGMHHTHYENVHGLPANNRTTAHDQVILLQHIVGHFPHAAAKYMTHTSVTYDGHRERAHHFLNNHSDPQGLPKGWIAEAKTGFTNDAGHNIATMVKGPDGKRMFIVVMGGKWTSEHDYTAMGMHPGRHGMLKGNRERDEVVGMIAQRVMGSSKGSHIRAEKEGPRDEAASRGDSGNHGSTPCGKTPKNSHIKVDGDDTLASLAKFIHDKCHTDASIAEIVAALKKANPKDTKDGKAHAGDDLFVPGEILVSHHGCKPRESRHRTH